MNGLEAPMDITDHAVLGSIERDLLHPEVVERAIEFAIDELRPGTDATRRAELLAEILRLDAELSRLTAAIARRGDLPALLAALKGTPGAARALRARRGSSWMPRLGSASVGSRASNARSLAAWPTGGRCCGARSRRRVRSSGTSSSAGSCSSPAQEARVYEFSGRGSFGRLLAGTTSPVSVVTPAGSDRTWMPEFQGVVETR